MRRGIGLGQTGAGKIRAGTAEWHDHRRAQGRRHVHGAGVVGEYGIAGGQDID